MSIVRTSTEQIYGFLGIEVVGWKAECRLYVDGELTLVGLGRGLGELEAAEIARNDLISAAEELNLSWENFLFM